MRYTKFSLSNKSQKIFKKQHRGAGVFLLPTGKWIVRIAKKSTFTTISQHETQEEAKTAYEKYLHN